MRVPEVTGRCDGRSVNLLTTFVRSLGNHRALANARAAVEVRQREDWLVLGLTHRLESHPGSGSVAVTATRATA